MVRLRAARPEPLSEPPNPHPIPSLLSPTAPSTGFGRGFCVTAKLRSDSEHDVGFRHDGALGPASKNFQGSGALPGGSVSYPRH